MTNKNYDKQKLFSHNVNQSEIPAGQMHAESAVCRERNRLACLQFGQSAVAIGKAGDIDRDLLVRRSPTANREDGLLTVFAQIGGETDIRLSALHGILLLLPGGDDAALLRAVTE